MHAVFMLILKINFEEKCKIMMICPYCVRPDFNKLLHIFFVKVVTRYSELKITTLMYAHGLRLIYTIFNKIQ